MTEHAPHAHHHSGIASKSKLNPRRVLEALGIRRGDVFMDAGAGFGQFSLAAAPLVGAEGKVYAVDIYAEGLAALSDTAEQQGLRNVDAIVADLTRTLPLPDAGVDACLMVNVLHGFAANGETGAAMGEIARVVKPGGVFAVVEWEKAAASRGFSLRRVARAVKRRLSHVSHRFAAGPPQSIRLSADEIAAAVTPFGFRLLRVVDPGARHTMVVFERGR